MTALRLFVLVALLLPLDALAARVQLSTNTRDLVVGQQGRFRLLVIDGAVRNPPGVSVPDGLTAQFIGQSQHMRADMSGMQRTLMFDYALVPTQEGTFTLGPFDVQVSGKTLTSNSVTLNVTSRPAEEVAQLAADAGFSVEEAWEGQVLLYHYVVRSRVELVDAPHWTLPPFDGLRAPRDGDRPQLVYELKDETGTVYVVERFIPLVATGTGKREPATAVVRVNLKDGSPARRTPFGGLFTPTKRQTLATPPSSLVVRPLPQAPDGFSGLVGEFEFSSSLSKQRLRVGESADWTIKVTGDGSLEGFSLPELPEVDGARLYDSGAQAGAQVLNGRYAAMGTFSRVVVATDAAQIQIPTMSIVTFSPSKGDFVTHEVELPVITVGEGGETSSDVESFAGSRPRVTEDGEIFDLHEIARSGLTHTPWLGPWIGVLIGLAALPGGFVLLAEGVDGLRGWWARRRRPDAPLTPKERVQSLPADPEERLAALDKALRDLLVTLEPDDAQRVADLRYRLQTVRFAGGEVGELEAQIVALVEELS